MFKDTINLEQANSWILNMLKSFKAMEVPEEY